ncbi:ABC transporter permease [Paenibacillus antri]|uniref:ABC transporter permease n=1 Tax=Paenibacillus antri TaxID=2582848 RepID=A0A5R9G914_9BACL|nr:ABC transporter permease [Paenibacillus antri]TLS49878.1 ABC transporter permease [Paenibacillus antri]
MNDFFEYVAKHGDTILSMTIDHIAMVASGLGLALLVGIPLGMVCARRERLGRWILGAANVIQVFPSLALLALLMIVLGLGFKTVVVGLFLYSLLPIIRNTSVGLKQVDKVVVEAGRGIGMNAWQLLWKVQFPLSLPFLLAGIRVAAVIAIGVATIAPLIGGGGLGKEIYAGINLRNDIRIFAGAVPAALLAIVADASLGRWERKLNVKNS